MPTTRVLGPWFLAPRKVGSIMTETVSNVGHRVRLGACYQSSALSVAPAIESARTLSD